MRREPGTVLVDFMSRKHLKLLGGYTNSVVSKCLVLVLCAVVLGFVMISSFSGSHSSGDDWFYGASPPSASISQFPVRQDKFLEVPQIVWGLNNQKIALSRACLTARLLNRTLLMPSLSASLFYKEVELLKPVAFNKVFQLEKFNSRCSGFVRIGRYSDLSNQTEPFETQKGSGRKWTAERDLNHLKQCKEGAADDREVLRIVGKNPFLWHDHWPVIEYARIFECLVFVDEVLDEATKVVSKIREMGLAAGNKNDATASGSANLSPQHVPYIAVHMRIEKDWMIHCKNLEQRSGTSQICSSKEEILERVGRITGLKAPTIVYLAIADSLLEDGSILSGWKEGLLPFEKKKLGVWHKYKRYPYLMQSAIDYEVCSRADIFVGNSFSTFSSLVVLDRTQKLIKMGITESCGANVSFASYAYNILGEQGGPRKWMADMSDSSLHALSYGSVNISCKSSLDVKDLS